MIAKIKRFLIANLKNIPGWRSNQKYLIIESDDWGSLQIIDKNHRDKLIKLGLLQIKSDPISSLDGLEVAEDFEMLYEVLTSVKDSNGNSAVFTPFINTGNPNFPEILNSDFESLHYEKFTDTYKKFGRDQNEIFLSQGVLNKILRPQLHGHGHVCDWIWFENLKSSSIAKLAIQNNFSSVTVDNQIKLLNGFRPTYFVRNSGELELAKISLKRAVNEFEDIMGYKAEVFDAPNAVFHPELEGHLTKFGIRSIVTPFYRNEPDFNGNVVKNGRYNFGAKNEYGQIYHIRNCMFEPYKGTTAETTLRMIDTCFRWGKPAVISSHRVNYVSSVFQSVRNNSLNELKKILSSVVKRHPDVQFISSGDLSRIMHNDIK
ncbi:MAG: hypothetical protein ACXIT9_12480 [Nitritalea sp.]